MTDHKHNYFVEIFQEIFTTGTVIVWYSVAPRTQTGATQTFEQIPISPAIHPILSVFYYQLTWTRLTRPNFASPGVKFTPLTIFCFPWESELVGLYWISNPILKSLLTLIHGGEMRL